MRQFDKREAFTLIELLVVVAVLGLMVALLIPAVFAAREAALSTQCKNNLRNLAFSVEMHTETQGGRFPAAWIIGNPVSIAWCGGYSRQNGVAYMDISQGPLYPYLQGKEMFRCPSFLPRKVKYAGSGEISGYGINCQYVAGDPHVNPNDGAAGMTSYARPARTRQIQSMSQTILFADCARFRTGACTEEIFIYPLYKHESTATNAATFHFRHSGLANVAFCDGHVEALEPTKLDAGGDGLYGWMENELMDRQ